MKNHMTYLGSVMLSGITLITIGCVGVGRGPMPVHSFAPTVPEPHTKPIVKTDLKSCEAKQPVISRADARSFPQERIAKTLNGVWRGKVWGEYPKEFLDKTGLLNVDYYMIVDAKRGEALVFEQFSDKRALPKVPAGTPTWSYLMCGKERYLPAHPPQVHEFQKVSNNVEDARTLLNASTGLTFDGKSGLVLSEAWKKLVDSKYFDTSKSPAYAGGFFKPFKMGNVPDEERGTLFSMGYQAEYRGSGMTAAKFEKGVPMHGIEEGKFLGVSSGGGDYLVSSLGNGVEMRKEVASAGVINMFFDKVVIGPLAQ